MDDREARERARLLADILRSSALSAEYYAATLRTERMRNNLLEGFVAVFTTGSVGAWAIWREEAWDAVWGIIVALVTVLSVLKPILKLGDRIARHSKLASAYHELRIDAKSACRRLHVHDGFTPELVALSDELRDRMARLEKTDDVGPDRERLVALQPEIARCYPPSFFWRPPGVDDDGLDDDAGSDDSGGRREGRSDSGNEEGHREEEAGREA